LTVIHVFSPVLEAASRELEADLLEVSPAAGFFQLAASSKVSNAFLVFNAFHTSRTDASGYAL
jgi:hypothetical protein